MSVFVYVLKSPSKKRRYVGIAINLERRLAEHRRGHSKGSQQLNRDFFVLLTEEFPDYKSAREREKWLKSGVGREWLDEYERNQRTGPASGG